MNHGHPRLPRPCPWMEVIHDNQKHSVPAHPLLCGLYNSPPLCPPQLSIATAMTCGGATHITRGGATHMIRGGATLLLAMALQQLWGQMVSMGRPQQTPSHRASTKEGDLGASKPLLSQYKWQHQALLEACWCPMSHRDTWKMKTVFPSVRFLSNSWNRNFNSPGKTEARQL